MSKQTIFIIAAVIFLGGIFALTKFRPVQEPAYCTEEAKLCPDGSYVGRTLPNCEFAACPEATSTPSGGGGIMPYDSGVKGKVLLGPTCPVVKNPPEPQCAAWPYQTLVAVFKSSDAVHAFAIGQSDASGSFSFSLPPGDYVLGAGESNLPRCNHVPVTVQPGAYADADISCDTGIR